MAEQMTLEYAMRIADIPNVTRRHRDDAQALALLAAEVRRLQAENAALQEMVKAQTGYSVEELNCGGCWGPCGACEEATSG